jgi:hypothetical protein
MRFYHKYGHPQYWLSAIVVFVSPQDQGFQDLDPLAALSGLNMKHLGLSNKEFQSPTYNAAFM